MSTRRDVVLGLAAAPAAAAMAGLSGPAFAQGTTLTGDAIETSAGTVTLHPVHHASLLIGFKEQVIYVDPVGGGALYAALPKATAILVTHAHPDHLDEPTLRAIGAENIGLTAAKVVADTLPVHLKPKVRVAANGDTLTFAGVPMTVTPAYNITPERLKYHPRGVGNGYVLTFGDKTVYIAGDTEDTPEMRALTGIDVAFLPMNLPYTMTVEQAADAVKAFRPKIVYPYHYKGSDTAQFKELVGGAAEVRLVDWYA